MKKMLALLLTLCLLAGMVPLGAGAEEQTVDTSEELVQAITHAQNGDVIKLGGNITIVPKGGDDPHLYAQMTVQNDITLDLDGYKIDFDKETTSSELPYFPLMISVNQGGKLRITGNGTIDADCQDNGAYGIDVNGGEVIVENGTFYGAPTAIQVTKGSLIINGGSFDLCQANKDKKPEQAKYVINCIDKAWGDGTATISVTGGSFCYDYYHNSPETTGSSYIANGYIVIEKDGQYVVEKLDATNAVASVGENYFKSVADAVEEAAKNNGTVILLRDAMFDTLSLSNGSVTVDLNGYTLTSDSGKTSDVTNSSKLIIQDSRGTGKLVYNGFQDLVQAAFEIQTGSSIALKGIHFETDATGVFAWGDAATVNVQGSVINAKGYCVGTNAGKDENYNVAIKITDGSVLTSALDGAGTAVLFNVPGTLDIENSTLNGHWQGIIARGGTITVRDSVITNTYDTPNTDYEDKWESGNGVTVAGIAIGNKGNNDYNYPVSVTLENTSVTSVGPNPAIYVYQMEGGSRTVTVKISGDSAVSGDFIVEKDANVEKVDVSISGGYFTSDPSDYVADGYYAGESDNPAYAYQVKKNNNTDSKPAEVVAAEPAVDTENFNGNDAEKVAAALAGTEATLDAAAKEQAAKNTVDADTAEEALEDASINVGTDTVTVVVQPYLEMKATGYSDDAAVKTMTVDIKAMYRTVATTAKLDGDEPEDIIVQGDDGVGETGVKANAVVIGEKENTLPVKGSVKISIPLPDGFVTTDTTPIYVQHENIYEYQADVTSETGDDSTTTYTATFTNPHGFSTFVLSTEPKAVATVNGTNYTNFQQAVNAAGANGTVTVQKGGQTATGVTHDLKLENGTGGPITVTINGKKITINVGETETFTYTAPTPPRPTEEKHSITISTDGKGQVTGPASAAEDDTVTLTVKPNADKELYDLKVTDEDGKAIAVTKVNDTTYTFTMPDGKVTIAAAFGCDGGDNCPSKAFTDLGDKQWYHDSIDYAVENGLLEGTSPTTMEPNATLIRAQLAQILYNIEDKPAVTGEMVFEDVPASEWFYSPILWANQNEIINGTSPITFEPLEDISRQDLALMLYRYAGKPAVTGDLDGFTDGDQVGDWAEEAMAWAVAEGIVQGDTPTTLNPTGTATRAEAAAMLQRFLEDAA